MTCRWLVRRRLVTRTPVTAAVGGDDVSLVGAATFGDKNVGLNKTVSIASPSLGGADAGNYNLTTVGTDTADISKLDTSGSFTAVDKTYDGTTADSVTGRTVTAAVGGDDVSLVGAATFGDKNVGLNKTVSIASSSLGGADAGNYNLTTV